MALATGHRSSSGAVKDAEGRAVVQGVGALTETIGDSGVTGTAPTALTAVAATGVLPAGAYSVTATALQVGTVDTNRENFLLQKGATYITGMLSLSTPVTVTIDRVDVNGSETINLITGAAAGGAGSIYVGTIQVTRFE